MGISGFAEALGQAKARYDLICGLDGAAATVHLTNIDPFQLKLDARRILHCKDIVAAGDWVCGVLAPGSFARLRQWSKILLTVIQTQTGSVWPNIKTAELYTQFSDKLLECLTRQAMLDTFGSYFNALYQMVSGRDMNDVVEQTKRKISELIASRM